MSRVGFPRLALHALLAIGILECSNSSTPPSPSHCGTETTGATSEGGSEYFGVPLTPGVYLINFLFLYIANPEDAANMPAYMAPLPSEFVACLRETPAGCPWEDYKQYFDLDGPGSAPPTSSRCECEWQAECQLPDFQELSAGRYQVPAQINQPLGMTRAKEMARLLGIEDSMLLTEDEYHCVIGTEPRTDDQEIIVECVANLTNSTGNADIPLSSYGLDISPDGLLRSNCAPDAPCLAFNELLAGPLEKMMADCGAAAKFLEMVTRTPFLEFGKFGNGCQSGSKPACVVEAQCSLEGA